MHSSGKYAFVEFRTPEMATASLDLSGQVGWEQHSHKCGLGEGAFVEFRTPDMATASLNLSGQAGLVLLGAEQKCGWGPRPTSSPACPPLRSSSWARR